MLSYILKQSHSFFPDAELEDSKLQYNPVPGNATPLDEFLRGVLEETLKHSQMHSRINFHKIQQLELHVLGPMAKICQKIEDSTPYKTDRVEIDLREFKELD